MKRNILTLIGVFLISSTSIFGQTDSLELATFYKAEKELVCLQNKKTLLPIKTIGTLKVGLSVLGFSKSETVFSETVEKYARVKRIAVPPMEKNNKASGAAIKKMADVIILGVDANYLKGRSEFFILGFNSYLKSLGQHLPVIAVIFGEGALWEEERLKIEADGLLFVPEKTKWHQSLAAQLIFGGIGTEAVLEKNLSGFSAGTGITLEPLGRFRYSPPEVVGMDARLLRDSINAIVEEGLATAAYPGAQVLVAKDGHVVFHKTYGFHTYNKTRLVKHADIYDFASVSKITSALPAVIKLYGDGAFDIDAPLKQYFPKFKKSNKAELTFRSMLSHNARLMSWIPYWQGAIKGNAKYPWQKKWEKDIHNTWRFKAKTFRRDSSEKYPIIISEDLWMHRDFKEKIYKAIKKSPLNEKEGYVYSGLLFYLLPEIVGDVVQMDFETYLKKTFYEPLGAFTLGYNPMRYYPKERMVPTERDTFFRMKQIHGRVHDEGAAMMAGVSANAGLFGSANDLAKLMQMYMNGGSYGGHRFISEEAMKEFTRCQYCEEGNRRGLGFDKPLIEYAPGDSYVAKSAGPNSFGHSGYTGTFTWADPDQKLLLVFFSNRVHPTRLNTKLYSMDIRPRVHQVLYDAIKE